MATKPTEDISFFYKPGSVNDPHVQKEMASNINAPYTQSQSKLKWVVIAGVIALAGLSVYVFPDTFSKMVAKKADVTLSVPVVPQVVEVAKQPNVFSTPQELQNVRNGDTGPLLNNRIDANLDTAKTQAQFAQDNATNKLKELAGIVDTYAPKLLNEQK